MPVTVNNIEEYRDAYFMYPYMNHNKKIKFNSVKWIQKQQ